MRMGGMRCVGGYCHSLFVVVEPDIVALSVIIGSQDVLVDESCKLGWKELSVGFSLTVEDEDACIGGWNQELVVLQQGDGIDVEHLYRIFLPFVLLDVEAVESRRRGEPDVSLAVFLGIKELVVVCFRKCTEELRLVGLCIYEIDIFCTNNNGSFLLCCLDGCDVSSILGDGYMAMLPGLWVEYVEILFGSQPVIALAIHGQFEIVFDGNACFLEVLIYLPDYLVVLGRVDGVFVALCCKNQSAELILLNIDDNTIEEWRTDIAVRGLAEQLGIRHDAIVGAQPENAS